MSARVPSLAVALAACALATPGAAHAQTASVRVYNLDAPGEGFNDPTPVMPVGGNMGATRGEQRMNAFQHAADIWAERLVSVEEVAVFANFNPLECMPDRGVLGQAGPSYMYANFPGALEPNTVYPPALANALTGGDLDNTQPEIQAEFNVSVDDADCFAKQNWYYGLDGESAGDIDLVLVVLHELGHGLGFADFVDHATGGIPMGSPEPFLSIYTHLTWDLDLGMHWDEMTQSERLQSVTNVHRVVWDGPQVTLEAGKLMAAGVPRIVTKPAVVDFTGEAADSSFSPVPDPPVTAALMLADDGSPPGWDACDPLAPLAGAIALVTLGGCQEPVKAKHAEEAGAVAVVIADDEAYHPAFHPRGFGMEDQVGIPVVGITRDDGARLQDALSQGAHTATVSLDMTQRAGLADGKLMLFATDPVRDGSSISHWDTDAYPNLLMEPRATPNLPHTGDLTLAALRDMGWPIAERCGNGVMEAGEMCDDGAANGDRTDACREDCTPARCGDGVVDTGEMCDDGAMNAAAPDACRVDCTSPRCGDTVVDTGEACDDGNLDPADLCGDDCALPPPPPMAGTPAGGGIGGGMAGASGTPGAGAAGMFANLDAGAPGADDGGCGCRVVGASGNAHAEWRFLVLAFTCLLIATRHARRRAR